MSGFKVYDVETAPEAARPLLQEYLDGYKFVPNMMGAMAESPELLAAYQALSGLWAKTELTPLERDVVLLAINRENGCRYCMASQSTVSARAGMPAEMLDALRNARPIDDAKLQTLRAYAETVVRKRGWVDGADLDALLAAGYTKRTALEVVLAASFKTLSNYTDHVTDVAVDKVFSKYAWTADEQAAE